MDFLEISIITMLCVLSFLMGQKFNNLNITTHSKKDKYKSIPETFEEDEEVLFFSYTN